MKKNNWHLRGHLLTLAALCVAGSVSAQFVAYNDHVNAGNTNGIPNPNTTYYSAWGTGSVNSGPLKDINSGATLTPTLTINNTGAGTGGTSGTPNAGSPADILFTPFCYFGTSSSVNGGGHAIQIDGSGANEVVDYVFANLDPNATYRFEGTGFRGNAAYTNRWILAEIISADGYVAYHSPGSPNNILTAADVPGAITASQVALNSGDNRQGSVIGWDSISPGSDGTFTIRLTQYTGTVPGGSSGGDYGYGFAALRLQEFSGALTPLSITGEPQDLTTNEYAQVSFTVAVSGSAPRYQWYFNSTAIPGAEGPTLVIPNVSPTNGGNYYVVVTNTLNAVTSRVATLAVDPDRAPPFVISAEGRGDAHAVYVTFSEAVGPDSATNIANYTLAVVGGGAAPGVTNAVMISSTVVRLDLDAPRLLNVEYLLNVRNVRDTAQSQNSVFPAQIPVTPDDRFVIFDFDQTWWYHTNDADLGAAWRAVDYVPTAPDWQQGQSLLGIETTPAIYPVPFRTTFTAYRRQTVTYYFITTFIITNDPASIVLVTSNYVDDGAIFWLNDQPAGLLGPGLDFNATYTNQVTSAAPEAQLREVTLASGGLRLGTNILAVEVHQNGTNSSDLVFGTKLMAFFIQPVAITVQPANTTVAEGQNATFTVTAANATTYQWWFGTQIIDGATNSTLVISNCTSANAGGYQVVAGNALGALTSQVATLTVNVDREPPQVLMATMLKDLTSVQLLFSEPVKEQDATNAANFAVQLVGGNPLSILGATLTNGTNLILTTSPRDAGFGNYRVTVLQIADLAPTPNVGGPVQLFAHVEETLINTNQLFRYNDSGLNLGTAWREALYLDEFSWPEGAQLLAREDNLAVLPIPTNTVLVLSNNIGGTFGAVTTYYFRAHFNFTGNPTGAWLKIFYAVDDGAVFYLNGQELFRAHMSATATITATNFATSHDVNGWEITNLLTSALVVGDNVLAVEVHQVNATSSDVVFGALLDVTAPPAGYVAPPRFVVQPQNFATNAGGGATFTTVVEGVGPFTYQWYFNAANALANETNATLTLNNVQLANEGTYSVAVANAGGAVTSAVATLTVLRRPQIVTDPANATVAVGASHTFTVEAEGSPVLTYQWYLNHTIPIPGATNAAFTLNNIQQGNAGDFRVVVANAIGSATSAVARLQVTGGAPNRPQIAPPVFGGGGIGFSFVSQAGFTYTLEYSLTLAPGSWQPVPGQSVAGDGTAKNLSDPNVTAPMRFYRLRVE